MDAKAMFKVKVKEYEDYLRGSSERILCLEDSIPLFAACIIAAAVGNGLEALTKAIADNTEEYRK